MTIDNDDDDDDADDDDDDNDDDDDDADGYSVQPQRHSLAGFKLLGDVRELWLQTVDMVDILIMSTLPVLDLSSVFQRSSLQFIFGRKQLLLHAAALMLGFQQRLYITLSTTTATTVFCFTTGLEAETQLAICQIFCTSL